MSEVLNVEEIVEQYEDDGFSINDDRGAEYALKRIRETQVEVDSFRAYYDEQIRKMQERADGIRCFYMAHLERYFNGVPHKSTKTTETYELPSAKLVLKAQAPEFVRDEDKILEWLKESGETQYIKVKESPNWSELKKNVEVFDGQCYVKETGELVPGVDVVQREPKFDVSFKEAK